MPNIDLLTETTWSEEDFEVWSFSHMTEHRDINRATLATTGIRIDEYVLHPVERGDDRWLYWHQVMHNETNKALGFQGYDLLYVDWSDPEDVVRWMSDNSDEHDRWKTTLNL